MNEMESFIRTSTILIAVAGLAGCAMEPRDGPPAPIVQVTPRDMHSAHVAPPDSVPEPEPAPQVAPPKPKPVKQATRVYAYQDPSAPPEPQAQPTAPGAPAPNAANQVAMIEPGMRAQPSAPSGAPGPAPSPGTTPAGTTTPPNPAAPSSATPGGAPVAVAPPKPKPKPEGPQKATLPQAEMPTAPTSRVARSQLPETAPVAVPSLPPAAQALAGQAEQQRQSGDYTGAAASLERSLRIAPREPYLWNRLARVRMEQGQTAQAGNLASRSNDLAGKDADVKKDNWRIIAESKRRAGDVNAASEAERRAGTD